MWVLYESEGGLASGVSRILSGLSEASLHPGKSGLLSEASFLRVEPWFFTISFHVCELWHFRHSFLTFILLMTRLKVQQDLFASIGLQLLETLAVGVVFREWVLWVSLSNRQEILCYNESATLLHDPVWFLRTSLVDIPNKIIADSLKHGCESFKSVLTS